MMLFCVYKTDIGLLTAYGEEEVRHVAREDVVWIDMLNPTPDDKVFVESKFQVELFTRQEAEEIESSSKFAESAAEINANLNYIYHKNGQYGVDPVSFILKSSLLITQRNIELRSFDEVARSFRTNRRQQASGHHIFLILLEMRIDIEADFLEDLSKQIYSTSKRLTIEKSLDEDVLIEISKLQELTMLFRESTSEMQRLISAILKSAYFPKDEYEKIRIMIKDVGSLLEHTAFNFERLEYLQNTFLGLVDMEQNRIIKIFTVVTVFFMPPTLIASLYGMNFVHMPEIKWQGGYPFALLLMGLSSAFTLFYFKKQKWL